MRKEAGLEPWRKLYEVTRLIGSLQPWDYLWDMDVVTLVLPEYEQPFFVSVMGCNGECYAITVMEGPEALRGFYRLAESREIPPGQLIRYQNNLTCYFGDRDELSKAERDRIKALGLKFRGRNQWISFRAFERGYAPHTLDEEQVLKLTRVFQELFMALRALLDPGDDEVAAVLGQIIDYIEDSGRPQKIFVRDEEMAHLLSDLCRRVDIPIAIEGSLQVIDDFAESFELLSF